MSSLQVKVTPITDIVPHPNADRLELALFEGWQCVVEKGRYMKGQPVVYLPVDSILPPELECFLFPIDSKIKLDKSRIRTIKIRKAISEGMAVSLHELREGGFLQETPKIGDDLADILGVTKYEPPEKFTPQAAARSVKKRYQNPNFDKYTDLENFKWYPDLFVEGEEVVIMEKIHGTNFRAGFVPFHANTIWKKIKKLLFPKKYKYEFVFGSHRVQLQDKLVYTGFYDVNVYGEAVKKYNLTSLLDEDVVVYGEIYGESIQPNYMYDCQPGERKMVVFDIKYKGEYLDHPEVVDLCRAFGLEHVPVLYVGPYQGAADLKEKYVSGKSVLAPTQKVREGIVIKPLVEQRCYMGRKILKYKCEEFLLKFEDNTH